MIEISIKDAVDKIRKQHSYLSKDVLNTAISRAINRTAQMTKSESNSNIRRRYNISTQKVNSSIRIKNSNKSRLEAAIIAFGEPLSLNNFQAKQVGTRSTTSFDRKGVASSRLNRKSRTNAVKGVSAIIKKGQEINLPTAFIQVANGGITVFARGKAKGTGEGFEFGKSRMPIGKITTTSIPLMFSNNEVLQPTGRSVEDFFIKRIDHEINFILSK